MARSSKGKRHDFIDQIMVIEIGAHGDHRDIIPDCDPHFERRLRAQFEFARKERAHLNSLSNTEIAKEHSRIILQREKAEHLLSEDLAQKNKERKRDEERLQKEGLKNAAHKGGSRSTRINDLQLVCKNFRITNPTMTAKEAWDILQKDGLVFKDKLFEIRGTPKNEKLICSYLSNNKGAVSKTITFSTFRTRYWPRSK